MIDIKDFNTSMDQHEYMRISVNIIPPCFMERYQLEHLVHNELVLVEIGKGMYGLPQAGKLANDVLVQHLSKFSHSPAGQTPGLFTYTTRPITFSLVVGDFGAQNGMTSAHRMGCEHVDALGSRYTITTEWPGARCLGLTLN
jgi:hypothetical protein